MDAAFFRDRKFVALVLVTAFTLLGILLLPSSADYPVLRYALANGGQISIALLAAWIGLERARYFTFGSAFGRSMLYMSLSMLSVCAGTLVWAYYNLALGVDVPYPSLADVFYISAYLLGGYGLAYLLKGLAPELGPAEKAKLAVLPLVVFVAVHLLFAQSDVAGNLPFLGRALNMLYPIGDAALLSLVLLMLDFSRGSAMSRPVGLVSAGFVMVAITNFLFSFEVSLGEYSTGSLIDLLFSAAFFVIGAGMSLLSGDYLLGSLSGDKVS